MIQIKKKYPDAAHLIDLLNDYSYSRWWIRSTAGSRSAAGNKRMRIRIRRIVGRPAVSRRADKQLSLFPAAALVPVALVCSPVCYSRRASCRAIRERSVAYPDCVRTVERRHRVRLAWLIGILHIKIAATYDPGCIRTNSGYAEGRGSAAKSIKPDVSGRLNLA
jgi:hypothetical protein